MILKLMAPFRIDGLRLNSPRVLQDPVGYAAAWDAVTHTLTPGIDVIPDLDAQRVGSLRCTHAGADREAAGSRYRSIDRHSLSRPLHLLELTVRLPASYLRSLLDSARCGSWLEAEPSLSETADQLVHAMTGSDTPQDRCALVRIYDHGIAQLELDLPVPATILEAATSQPPDPDQPGRLLETLQQLGIDLAEHLIDECHDHIVAPLASWLHRQEPLCTKYLSHDTSSEKANPQPRTLWVTRSLVFGTPPGQPGSDTARQAVARHWLKDVHDAHATVQRCLDDPSTASTSWLNYLFGESSYPSPYPPHGWHNVGGRALPFTSAWDALLIAQYYYAAFDLLQSHIARILAIAVAGEGRHKVADIKNLLDRALRDANMLKLEFDENRKYYARQTGDRVTAILEAWNFDSGLRRQVDARLDDCSSRLEELHARSLEHSAIYTDLILLAIGVTAVFEVLLYLAEYGRTMASDADLAVYDRTSNWNIATWIGASSTDAVLLAGAVFSVGLVCLYAYFRISRSRV